MTIIYRLRCHKYDKELENHEVLVVIHFNVLIPTYYHYDCYKPIEEEPEKETK